MVPWEEGLGEGLAEGLGERLCDTDALDDELCNCDDVGVALGVALEDADREGV